MDSSQQIARQRKNGCIVILVFIAVIVFVIWATLADI